jgi:hypothetical protein
MADPFPPGKHGGKGQILVLIGLGCSSRLIKYVCRHFYSANRQCLLTQVHFEPVNETEYIQVTLVIYDSLFRVQLTHMQIESQFNSGRYAFKVRIQYLKSIRTNNSQIEETVFSMAEYTAFKASIAEELTVFEEKQKQGVQQEEIK